MHKTGMSMGLAAGLAAATWIAQAQEIIPVWPEGRIPLKTSDAAEKINPSKDDIIRLTDVNVPTLTFFRAPQVTQPTPAVLICPGGGYSILAWNHEGTEVAAWLNAQGISAFVLKYRVPGNRDAAFSDAQRAISLIRAQAATYNVNPKKIGIMGFSAGGHLSVRTSTNGDHRFYAPVDSADEVSCRPDFALVIYPAYLSKPDFSLTEGLPVDAKTPKTFIVQSTDDAHYIDSAVAYYMALKKAKVPVEMHLFPDGGHGYGMRKRNTSSDAWTGLAEVWLKRYVK